MAPPKLDEATVKQMLGTVNERSTARQATTLDTSERIDDCIAQVLEHMPALTREDPLVPRQVAKMTNWTPEAIERYIATTSGDQTDWRDGFTTLDDLMKVEVEGARWLIEDCVRAGAINMFVGASKAGKSRLALAAVEAILTGRPFLGEFAVPEDACGAAVMLFLGDSDGADEHTRLMQDWATKRGLGGYGGRLRVNTSPGGLDLNNKQHLAGLIERIQGLDPVPAVLVFDSVYNFTAEMDDNDRAQVKVLMRSLSQVCEKAGVTIIGIEHSPKSSSGDGANAMIGSQAKGAATRSGINLERLGPNDPDGHTSKVRMNRWGNQGRSWTRTYIHDPGAFTWTRMEDAAGEEAADLCSRAAVLLSGDGVEWMTLKDIAQGLGLTIGKRADRDGRAAVKQALECDPERRFVLDCAPGKEGRARLRRPDERPPAIN